MGVADAVAQFALGLYGSGYGAVRRAPGDDEQIAVRSPAGTMSGMSCTMPSTFAARIRTMFS